MVGRTTRLSARATGVPKEQPTGTRIADASDSLISSIRVARAAYEYVNPALAGFLGVSRKTLLSARGFGWARTRVHPEDLTRIVEERNHLLLRLRAEGRKVGSMDQEYRLKNGAGEWRWVRARVTAHLHGARADDEIIVVGHDVTDRRRAEDRLAANEEMFRQVVEHLKDVFWILSPDLRTTLYLSPAYAEIWGRPVRDALSGVSDGIWEAHPDDRDLLAAARERARHSHQIDATFRIAGVDGQTRWIESRGFAVYREGAPGDGGRPIHSFVGFSRDITEQHRAFDDLKTSQARLSQAQEMTESGSWHLSLTDDTLWWSNEVYRIFGLDPAQGPRRFLERAHPADRGLVQAAEARMLATAERYAIDFRIVRSDGDIRFVHEQADVVFDQGRAVRLVGSIQDVTAQRAATHLQRTLAGAVAQTDDHVFVTDRNGSIEFANPAFERTSGYSLDEIRGKTPRILKSEGHTEVFYERLWKTICAGEVFKANFRNRRKDGSTYIEEKTISPVRDEGGNITHFVSVGRDITARRAAEDEQLRLVASVRRGAAEWTATFDAVEMPLAVIDRSGRVSRLNLAMAQLAGMRITEMVGKPLPEADGEPWASLRTLTRQAFLSGRSAQQESLDPTSGQTWQSSANPIPAKALGASPGQVVVARDITSFVQLQERLRRNETMSAMGELLAGVAHEVRNPLFGISATLDAFEEDFSHVGDSVTYLRLIRGEVDRLTALMRDLLEYGKRSDAALEPGPIEPVVRRAVRACLPMATPRVSINVEIADDLDPVTMDPPRLAQVIQNLVENAVQHSSDGGQVTVRCQRVGWTIRCTVEDDGSGISETDAPHVFEPFYSRRRGGTGLGLSIVQRITEEHGGQVILRNRTSGGTAAIVDLPSATAPENR